MSYAKKVIVLKQIEKGFCLGEKNASAIARIEIENGVGDFFLSVINVSPIFEGDYYLYICDCSHNLFSFELEKRPITFTTHLPDSFNLDGGFSVGLCFVKDCIPALFCYAKTDDCTIDVITFKKKIAENLLSLHKSQPSPEKDFVLPPSKNQDEPKTSSLCENYDDEAVATQNYFTTEEQIFDKIDKIEEFNRERLSYENDLAHSPSGAQKSQSQTNAVGVQDEKNLYDCEKEKPYYLTVKDELDRVFATFEEEVELAKLFPNGRWAKINYSKELYYVVGVIVENDVEKYICYGVPDNYSDTPPKEFDGYCVFLPSNPEKTKEKGYWMMFQDAFSGRCVSRKVTFTPCKTN